MIDAVDLLNRRIAELEAQLAECQRERDALREALSGLYQHTKNNYVIAGLNTAAREALAATKENDGE